MRKEWIIAVCVGRKNNMATAELTSEAVGAEGQMSMLPTARGHYGPRPKTQG